MKILMYQAQNREERKLERKDRKGKLMRKISIIGNYGLGETCLDGQTIKTKIVSAELEKEYGENQVVRVNTYGGIKAYLRLPFQIFNALRTSRNIIILPARNGVRAIGPLLDILNIRFRRKLHYVVIGGWLPELVEKRPFLKRHLKNFSNIYVETNEMKRKLELQGFRNTVIMPNFKELRILKESELIYSTAKPYKLCTFSRVMKEKGIEDAVKTVVQFNEERNDVIYSLDIFGQIDTRQSEWFSKLKSTFPDYIRYCGTVPYDKTTERIKEYFALLFPTYYEGEGYAGTLVDAMAAGVPVIATEWRYNAEIIMNHVNGRLYHTFDNEELKGILMEAYRNPSEWKQMKKNCLQNAQKNRPTEVIRILSCNLD